MRFQTSGSFCAIQLASASRWARKAPAPAPKPVDPGVSNASRNPARYASARLWATARDGTKVPVSLVHRKDVKPDGTAPLWLYGYGSYGITTEPGFADGDVVELHA